MKKNNYKKTTILLVLIIKWKCIVERPINKKCISSLKVALVENNQTSL